MQRDDDARLDELDAEDVELIAKLRTLPPEGEEPHWRELEAAIRARVSPLAMPAPWWRNWRWLAPIGALATTAAIVAFVTTSHDNASESRPSSRDDARTARTEDPMTESQQPPPPAPAPAVWLDGESVELDETASLEALDDVDELGLLQIMDDATLQSDDEELSTMLPVADDRWVDSLDDDAVARIETFLTRKGS
jgi:hypothetical protein